MDPALEIEIAALSRQKAMNEALKQGDSDIQKFYANTTVFITGGTGFLGKHLIEKLFRACKITKMYLLMRPKKGKTIKERLEEMLEDPVFSGLQKCQPDFSSRLVCVEGDVSEIRLGLSESDWQTLADEVEVIFHCAATTRFDEKLRTAARINVRGTREALLLARAAGRLKSFVYVSTAYSHTTTECEGQEIQEDFYPTPISPDTLLHLVEEIDERRLDAVTPEIIKNWPNTYTFCKAVGEEAVRTMSEGLPVCIVRPGIVVASYCEPTPGWLDRSSAYSASGKPTQVKVSDISLIPKTIFPEPNIEKKLKEKKILLGVGLGVLHVVLNDHQVKVGLVPCDYVTNTAIVAGRETSCTQRKGGNDTPIYNVTSVARNPVTWKTISDALRNDCRRIATPMAVYYAYAIETSNLMLFHILSVFLHLIPAYLMDFCCFLLRRERQFVKLSTKVQKMTTSLSYFCLNQWIFVDNNTDKLYKNLSKRDQLLFNFDFRDINWTEFIIIWVIGLRKYIVKDGLKSTDLGVKKQFWFKFLHYILSFVYIFIVWKVISFVYYGFSGLSSLLF